MSNPIDKNYNQNCEGEIYRKWEESGYFNPDKLPSEKKENYSIMMPPPNVTGVLHLGHALENTIMDIQIRYQRMKGKRTLLLPGTDHAAIATQAKVEKILMDKGIGDPRKELGREKLLAEIRDFAEKSKSNIINQIKTLGTSCDWSRLAYTFDETRSKAVNEIFIKMYHDGLIYRGYRTVNWSITGQSTLSDDEVEYSEEDTTLYTFKYSHDFPIAIATTRPETKLGDTAVAVNPKDDGYKNLIGQEFTINIGAAKPLKIKIIGDENIDPGFGTGALGVTCAHSHIDYEIYQKNKEIGLIPVIGKDGKMNENAGSNYEGLTINEARDKFVNWLKDQDLLIKEEKIKHNIGRSDRYKDIVEVLPMKQWFVDVNKKIAGRGKSLKELMKEAVAKEIKIQPKRFEKIYFNWIDNLRDWCISRQIWWGHRIPVWYQDEKIFVGTEKPEGDWIQDPDTLDTWFSSGTWTFSTLGWPEQTEDMQNYHPSAWMQMGYEILFFWMARMILMSTYGLEQIPFRQVYIHGMLRDKQGRKFSKSLGNGRDPIEVIEQYGADALRLSLVKGLSAGNDSRFYEEKVVGARNFVNKLWNISRYILTDNENSGDSSIEYPEAKTEADKWILGNLNSVIKSVTKELDKCYFSQASEILYDFTWNKFADWYLEVAKIEEGKQEILLYILQTLLKLWHPFCPFVTEKIWKNMGSDKLLMVEEWPMLRYEANASTQQPDFEQTSSFEKTIEIINAIRSTRADYRIDPAVWIKAKIDKVNNPKIIEKLARVKLEGLENKGVIKLTTTDSDIYLAIGQVMDIDKEKKRIKAEIENLDKLLTGVKAQLGNEKFLINAKAEIVEGARKREEEYGEKLEKLRKQKEELGRI